jgi:methyl-accepting chemotaxis protein
MTKEKTANFDPDHEIFSVLTVASAINLLSNPVMLADKNYVIRYVNEAAYLMFEAIEEDIRRDLPNFRAREILGKSIDVFHKTPAYQHGLLKNMTDRHDGKFTVGCKHLAFRATPFFCDDGSLRCMFVEWQDRTREVLVETQTRDLISEMTAMANAHKAGDIDIFVEESKFSDVYMEVAAGVNAMVREHISVKNKVVAVVQRFAEGDFDAPLETFPGKRAFLNVAVESIRSNLKNIALEIERLSNAIVEGALDISVDRSKFKGGFSAILDSFDAALGGLNDAFSAIQVQIAQISETVDKTSSASRGLAENSQIQSSSVDEVSSSAEETESQVAANAAAAKSARALVDGTSLVAEEGKAKITEMVTAMEGIRVSSQDIAKIIKVIDEIAFQTNLLALNAAVEAARAGQHGRGFAVVAQEVRNLAGRSAKAARETSDLIESASSRVRDGVRIADETSVSFTTIADDIVKVKALVSDIAVASDEQSRGVAQINVAIGEIAKSALATSRQAESLAESASDMKTATDGVSAEVARYRLRPRKTSTLRLEDLTPEAMEMVRDMLARRSGAAGSPSSGAKAVETVRHRDRDERGFGNF